VIDLAQALDLLIIGMRFVFELAGYRSLRKSYAIDCMASYSVIAKIKRGQELKLQELKFKGETQRSNIK
jgi:hypothetical protein